jgi:hypothetical protein
MRVADFVGTLPGRHKLTDAQASNLEGLGRISETFHRKCGIEPVPTPDNASSIIIESGHQPNFIPHAGVWRKVFLLDYFAGRLRESGHTTVPIFGFADYNLSTASLLHHSKIPDHNREGFRKIGFDMRDGDRWKCFNTVEKPSTEALEAHLIEIYAVYEANSKRGGIPFDRLRANLDLLSECLRKSHEKAGSFAEFNAFFFARICSEHLGFKVRFFSYTDVQKEGIFLAETMRLASQTAEYNKAANASVEKRGLIDELGQAEDYYFPFWYHCGCGGKVALSLHDGVCQGRCPVCDTGHRLRVDELGRHYSNLAPTAIARNLIFSEGLGTTMFISGSGGGLRYGAVANDVSDALGFHKPTTLTWKARDYYIGAAQAAALTDLAKALCTTLGDLSTGDIHDLAEKRRMYLDELLAKTLEDDKKTRQRVLGQQKNVETQVLITNKLFNVTPTALDVFANVGDVETLIAWNSVLESADVEECEFKTIKSDVVYSKEASGIYARFKGPR